MPEKLVKDALMSEVLRLLRGEMTTRRRWERMATLGRRELLRRLDGFLYARRWDITHARDAERHLFAAEALQLLEQVGAVDLISAGRWAEKAYDDPMEKTQLLRLMGR